MEGEGGREENEWGGGGRAGEKEWRGREEKEWRGEGGRDDFICCMIDIANKSTRNCSLHGHAI